MVFRRYLCIAIIANCLLAVCQPFAHAAEEAAASLAHIKLKGDLDEAPVAADPLFGSSGENFKTKLDRIKKAICVLIAEVLRAGHASSTDAG